MTKLYNVYNSGIVGRCMNQSAVFFIPKNKGLTVKQREKVCRSDACVEMIQRIQCRLNTTCRMADFDNKTVDSFINPIIKVCKKLNRTDCESRKQEFGTLLR
jgi:Elicitin